MCRLCGDPRCGTVDLYEVAAAPVSEAVAALKADGYKAIGVNAMAHESKGPGPTLAELGQMAQEAHEAKHGVAKANDNLPALAGGLVHGSGKDGEPAAAKADARAEDKAVKGPKD